MRFSVLGVGGVGGLVGAALARSGHHVTLVVRPEARSSHPSRLRLESGLLGDFEVEARLAGPGDPPADVLWVTVKATQLEAALRLADAHAGPGTVVVPLLNGVDHMTPLRAAFGDRVVAGAIRVESERIGPGHILHSSPIALVELAPSQAHAGRIREIDAALNGAGLRCGVGASEAEVLWSKMAFLTPFALGTTSLRAPIGRVREDPELRALILAVVDEVCAVAAAEGARLDAARSRDLLLAAPAGFRSSMQKDREAGNPLELDAITGPVIRRGRAHGVPTPATEELRRRIEAAATV
jgi:2-dehydropantoate 2-reductase